MPRKRPIDPERLLEKIFAVIKKDVMATERKQRGCQIRANPLPAAEADKMAKYAKTISVIIEVKEESKSKLKKELSKLSNEELIKLIGPDEFAKQIQQNTKKEKK